MTAPAKRCASCAWYVKETDVSGRCYSQEAKITLETFTFFGPGAPVAAYGKERKASDGGRCKWHELASK